MDSEKINSMLRAMGHEFDTFANALAEGAITELAPPFSDYVSFDGNLIDYYQQFFQKYQQHLKLISDKTWEFINVSMRTFIKHHTKTDVVFDLRAEVGRLMEAIIDSLSAYYNGSPSLAYNTLEKMFLANELHLLQLLPQIHYQGFLYRVRKERGLSSPKELFHTPFENRTKCGSYRFSILGYPSLYLAGSLETSIKESRIEDNNYSAICFKSNTAIECIDLTLPNRELSLWERYSLVLFYPLIMACGLKVREENDTFKPEYVVPQLLFQVISEHSNLMGVSYTTTRADHPDYRDSKQRNFVIKVPKAYISRGQSKELASLFECTLPISPEENDGILDIELKLRDSLFINVL